MRLSLSEILFTIIAVIILFRLLKGSVMVYKYSNNSFRADYEKPKKEGEITIEKIPDKNKKTDNGEYVDYVDYEEVK